MKMGMARFRAPSVGTVSLQKTYPPKHLIARVRQSHRPARVSRNAWKPAPQMAAIWAMLRHLPPALMARPTAMRAAMAVAMEMAMRAAMEAPTKMGTAAAMAAAATRLSLLMC